MFIFLLYKQKLYSNKIWHVIPRPTCDSGKKTYPYWQDDNVKGRKLNWHLLGHNILNIWFVKILFFVCFPSSYQTNLLQNPFKSMILDFLPFHFFEKPLKNKCEAVWLISTCNSHKFVHTSWYSKNGCRKSIKKNTQKRSLLMDNANAFLSHNVHHFELVEKPLKCIHRYLSPACIPEGLLKSTNK